MTFPWQRMTIGEFADFERILNPGVVQANGIYWRRVRPMFYRSLLPFQEYDPALVKPPAMAWFGGFQHTVPPGEIANSFLNLLMFEEAGTYSLDSLDYQRRRQVKLAAKQFTIRPITDKEEFKEKAYPVYRSFYERTQYQYGSQRTKQDFFSRWTDALFQIPKLVALGGYRNGVLGGVSLSLLLEDTLYYAIFFCDTESLRSQLSGLMLHSLREWAAECKCARQIFAGLCKNEGGKGVDDFYLQRGCKLVKKPALLQINPLTAFLLRRFLPGEYDRLIGDIRDARGSQAVERSASFQKPGTTVFATETQTSNCQA